MEEREVSLSVKQVQRYEVIRASLVGRMTVLEAAPALGVSPRQVKRLRRKVEAAGAEGVIHGNAGREPHNRTPDDLRERVIGMARHEYARYNFSHLADTLSEEHGVKLSAETLRLWLRPLGHGRPSRRVKTHRRRRPRRPREGELLFLDGSPHRWFGEPGPEVCLLLCSDATGKPLWGKFQPTADRDGCLEVCYQVFKRKGLPASFYLDRARQFITTRHGGTHVQQGPEIEKTHFEIAMEQLAIGLIFAHSPQARGRGERLNGTFQGRLVAELTRNRMADCQAATAYLNRVFIPKFCRRFQKPPQDPKAAWRPLLPHLELKSVLRAKSSRTVQNDNTVSLQGALDQLFPPPNRSHLVHAKIEIQKWFDGSLHFHHPRLGEIKARPLTKTQAQSEPGGPGGGGA